MPAPSVILVGPEIQENLGLRYLASSLRASGFGVEVIPFNASRELATVLERVVTARPTPVLVGLSLSFQRRAQDFLALAMGLRQRGFAGHVTVGGHFAAFAAGELLSDFAEIDSVCLHEAEETAVDLARALAVGEGLSGVAGIASRGVDGAVHRTAPRPPPDLATLPWPDREGEPRRYLGRAVAPVIASRGCYGACSFCCIAAWHALSPGKRYRLRDMGDVAEEMAWLHRERGVDFFVFQDDDFFVPRLRTNLERVHALADELARRDVAEFAVGVKARPTDVHPELVDALVERLHCIEVSLGIENDHPDDLRALNRNASPADNQRALDLLREGQVLDPFNLQLFHPDATVESLRTNLAFMERNADAPFNFGRTNLYAGTPILERMRDEGRCEGDYLWWSYRIADPEVEEVYQVLRRTFGPRTFGVDCVSTRILDDRLRIELARRFFPHAFDPAWRDEAVTLTGELGRDSVAALGEIIDFVGDAAGGSGEAAHADFVRHLGARLRALEADLDARMGRLMASVRGSTGAP